MRPVFIMVVVLYLAVPAFASGTADEEHEKSDRQGMNIVFGLGLDCNFFLGFPDGGWGLMEGIKSFIAWLPNKDVEVGYSIDYNFFPFPFWYNEFEHKLFVSYYPAEKLSSFYIMAGGGVRHNSFPRDSGSGIDNFGVVLSAAVGLDLSPWESTNIGIQLGYSLYMYTCQPVHGINISIDFRWYD